MKLGLTAAAMLVSSTVVVDAFAPPMPPTAVAGVITRPAEITQSTPFATNRVQHPPSSSTSKTTLYSSISGGDGNFFDRLTRVTKSNLNKFIQKYEDPEKVMNQAVMDMQNDLVKLRQAYAEVTASQRRLLQQKVQFEAVADDWYRRAQLALKRDNEGLAREALARRQQALDEASRIDKDISGQTMNVDRLYEGLQTLESKIIEAKAKKDQMATRAKTAKNTQRINDYLSGLTGRTSMDAFKRMEEKVMALEAAAEVSYEMGQVSMNKLLSPTSSSKGVSEDVETQFRRLEASSAVDKELEKLKNAMLPPASLNTISSSSNVASTSKNIHIM